MNTLNPFISIITPVYNDPDGLGDTLQSLIKQDYPPDSFEIIVADNGSTDNTLDVARDFSKQNPELIKIVIEDEIQSSYAARNKGVKIAKGEIIAFIDADMSVENDWLERISLSMKENDVDYIACKVNIYSESNSVSSLYNQLSGFPLEEYINNRHFAPTCCLTVRKDIFEKVGLFNPNLISSGDYEFGNRVYNAGYKLYYDSSIVMKHPARTSFSQLMKKSFRIGRGFYQLAYYYPKMHKSMSKNIKGFVSKEKKESWNLFTFKKEDELWNTISIFTKTELYFIDIINKVFKPIGYFYEKILQSKKHS